MDQRQNSRLPPPPQRPRSRSSVQFPPPTQSSDQRPCSPSTCRVSDCWSPTSDMDMGSRPLGGLEKVIEYRPVPNGHGIELRRVTASADGPVEHIQVVNQSQPWIADAPPPPPPPSSSMWHQQPTDHYSSRLAMNGSQPCLMIPEVEAAGGHDLYDHYYGPGQVFLDAPCGAGGPAPLLPPPPPMIERQRSLPRTTSSRRQRGQQQMTYQAVPTMPPMMEPLSQKGRTSSMGKLDPMGYGSSGSQPCLLVAQTVSNRRKRHAQELAAQANSSNNLTRPSQAGPGQQPPAQSKSSKKSFQRSESFQHHQQSHFFVKTQMDEPHAVEPLTRPQPTTPSLSPISVVRNKRANQANWEKHQRKNSAAAIENAATASETVENCVSGGLTPILGSAAASCTGRRQSTEDEDEVRTDDQMTEDSHADDLTVPPPPSPPCTCGKNLELPPTPPLDDLEAANNSQFQGSAHHHQHPGCTEIETLQAQMEQMSGPGTCGPVVSNSSFVGGGNTGTGNRSNRSRRGSSRATMAMDAIDIIDPAKGEKTVNFANCVSPPSPHDPGIMGINNEAYPCDCCQIDEAAFRRSYTHQIPCGSSTGAAPPPPNGSTMHFSERDFKRGSAAGNGGISNGHCSNGIVIGEEKASKITLPRRGSRSSKRQQQQQQQQQKKFFQAKFHEQERGISLEFGKFVALISISGVHLRRQHWCLLSIFILVVVLCIAIGLPISTEGPPSTPEARIAAVKKLLKEVPLIDGHNDLPWNIRKFIHNKLNTVNFTTNLKTENPWGTSQWSHTDLGRMVQGHLGGQLWVAYAPCGSQHKDAVQVTLEQIDLIKRFINQYPNHLKFVNDSTAVLEAHAEGKIASMISVESGHSIGTSLAVLRMFHRLGAISLTLTHNCNTPWADCSNVDKAGGKPEHNGLSSFGKTVIKELNRLGMIIDLSHSSHKTALDTIETSDAPVIFSHSSAFALCNSTRNVQDDVLKLLAKKRGLVMVNFFSYFLTCSNTSTVNDVVAHLNHIRTVAGVDHVGIGASYDGINSTPRGLEDVSQYPELFATLLASGMWTIEDLKKLAGLNFLRVFREVERVSQVLRPSQGPSEDHIDATSLQEHVNCRSVAKREAGTPC